LHLSHGALYGDVPEKFVGREGCDVMIPDNTGQLGKPGYIFDGWNTEYDGA
jgi:hypothetical protein